MTVPKITTSTQWGKIPKTQDPIKGGGTWAMQQRWPSSRGFDDYSWLFVMRKSVGGARVTDPKIEEDLGADETYHCCLNSMQGWHGSIYEESLSSTNQRQFVCNWRVKWLYSMWVLCSQSMRFQDKAWVNLNANIERKTNPWSKKLCPENKISILY